MDGKQGNTKGTNDSELERASCLVSHPAYQGHTHLVRAHAVELRLPRAEGDNARGYSAEPALTWWRHMQKDNRCRANDGGKRVGQHVNTLGSMRQET
jgi:hypothetical protein